MTFSDMYVHNIHICVYISKYKHRKSYIHVYICVYICVLQQLMKKEITNLKEQGGLYGRAWKEKSEAENYVIIV